MGHIDEARQTANRFYEEFLFSRAEGIIKEGGAIPPAMIVLLEDGTTDVYPLDNMPKALAMELHRRCATLPGVDCAALVSEAWALQGKADNETLRAALQSGRSIEGMPGSYEVVVFSLRSGPRVFLATCRIDREALGLERAELVDTQASDARYTGRMVS